MELKIVKNKLIFQEYLSFINNVVDMVFLTNSNDNEENNIIDYKPELYDLALKLEFAKNYMGYNYKNKQLEEIYNDLSNINVTNYLNCGEIDKQQYISIQNAIVDKISIKKQQILSTKKDSLNELLNAATSYVKALENKLDDLDLNNTEDVEELNDKIKYIKNMKFDNTLQK